MRLGISTQQGIIERVARRVRARMGMNVDQSRKKPAAVHHGFGARDGLMRNAIAVDPEIEDLITREADTAKVYRLRAGLFVYHHPSGMLLRHGRAGLGAGTLRSRDRLLELVPTAEVHHGR
jgi:hypothetical protein